MSVGSEAANVTAAERARHCVVPQNERSWTILFRFKNERSRTVSFLVMKRTKKAAQSAYFMYVSTTSHCCIEFGIAAAQRFASRRRWSIW